MLQRMVIYDIAVSRLCDGICHISVRGPLKTPDRGPTNRGTPGQQIPRDQEPRSNLWLASQRLYQVIPVAEHRFCHLYYREVCQ